MTLSISTRRLAQHLGEQAHERGLTITTAESCTGGGVAYAITSVSGSSAWFKQGIVSYENAVKHRLLDVAELDLQKHGAVSPEVAAQMAKGAALNAGADCAVATTGVAGPTGGSVNKPVGLVWFGFCVAGTVVTRRKQFQGDRHQVREQAIDYALNEMLLLIQQSSDGDKKLL